ncbi:MAG: hypothetical protein AAF986_10615, partial [Pseudomonadota bacterium]
ALPPACRTDGTRLRLGDATVNLLKAVGNAMSRTKFAPMHSGLLARKGEALPAATHPLSEKVFTDQSPTLRGLVDKPSSNKTAILSGASPQEEDTSPEEKTVYIPPSQREETSPQKSAAPSTSTKSKSYKISLRINERQRRLIRMIAAIRNESQQSTMRNALDQFLEQTGQEEMKTYCRRYMAKLNA